MILILDAIVMLEIEGWDRCLVDTLDPLKQNISPQGAFISFSFIEISRIDTVYLTPYHYLGTI